MFLKAKLNNGVNYVTLVKNFEKTMYIRRLVNNEIKCKISVNKNIETILDEKSIIVSSYQFVEKVERYFDMINNNVSEEATFYINHNNRPKFKYEYKDYKFLIAQAEYYSALKEYVLDKSWQHKHILISSKKKLENMFVLRHRYCR